MTAPTPEQVVEKLPRPCEVNGHQLYFRGTAHAFVGENVLVENSAGHLSLRHAAFVTLLPALPLPAEPQAERLNEAFRNGAEIEAATPINTTPPDSPERRRSTVVEGGGELDALRSFARDVRDNYECDSDAHKYGTRCRACEAAKVLIAEPTQPAPATEADAKVQCAICRNDMEVVRGNKNQPCDGGEMELRFCFGSAKLDLCPGITTFRGFICDGCAVCIAGGMEASGTDMNGNPHSLHEWSNDCEDEADGEPLIVVAHSSQLAALRERVKELEEQLAAADGLLERMSEQLSAWEDAGHLNMSDKEIADASYKVQDEYLAYDLAYLSTATKGVGT